ncbi:MAG: arylsulfatase [Thermoanaerobaculaceae bacterium]|nr:arylsulfatase [Thermoanaerobaculaceae bacterium]
MRRLRLQRYAGGVLALGLMLGFAVGAYAQQQPQQQPKKPNILVIMADDIGIWNISAYHRGMMGGRTPNIDRLASEGALWTDYYGQQSCTAGRAAFILGQTPFRTGLLKVGMPGANQGIQAKDPTIAELLKPLGYVTAQTGKNHLGDRNEMLPTVHGFDEFYGNLYHLNAEEEPEDADYPKNPQFKAHFGPRGLLDCKATSVDDPTEDPRFGKVGKQTCKDTGPITRTRMQTVEEELTARSLDFIERSVKAGKPFFLWHNTTRMHVWTRLSPKWENKSGYGLYADGMMELDDVVGRLLKKLDDLGIADNTIVVFTTDNGAEIMSWPDGGNTPFHGEKGSTWEGGMRVPALARWPGVLKPGAVHNEVMAAEDWMPTLVAAAGDPDVTQKLLKGYAVGDKTFKNHLDGYNFLPFFKGQAEKPPRREIFYFDDNANLNAIRIDDWKISFKIMEGNIASGKVIQPNMPLVINLRQDPFERFYGESQMWFRWAGDKLWMFVPAQMVVGQFIQSFKEYPPSQKSGSFSVDQVLEALQTGATGTSK